MKGWRHNHVDEEYTFTPESMVDLFFDSQCFKDWKAGVAFNLDRTFLTFISMPLPDGIDSYIEREDVKKILDMIHSDPRRKQ